MRFRFGLLIILLTSLVSVEGSKRAIADDSETSDLNVRTLSYSAINLYKQAENGHLQLIGPMLSPGAPGWKRLSSSTQLSGTFREPQRLNGKLVSWLEGRGGTITFPVSESEHQLEEMLIWIHPIASHQVVSIFVDEQLVKNLSLKNRGSLYRLALPQPLSLGEHSLRLYFRYTRPASWGGRTPGALGPLSFVPRGQREQLPEHWSGELIYQQRKWGALFAPPPATWRFYFFPPADAQFNAHLYLPPFAPKTRFQVLAATDEIAEKIIFDQELTAGKKQEAHSMHIKVSLRDFVGQATRLTLKTHHIADHPLAQQRPRKARRAPTKIGWLNPRIESRYPAPLELPRAKRLIVWAVDGLKLERFFAHPHIIKFLPSLGLMINKGIRFTRLWSDNEQSLGGHRLLLYPPHNSESLVSKVRRARGQTVYIGSTLSEFPKLDVKFNRVDYVDPGELEDHPYRALLTQVQQVFRLRQALKLIPSSSDKRFARGTREDVTPELIYIHSPRESSLHRRYPFEMTQEERAWLDQAELSKAERHQNELWLNRLKELDYTLSLLLSELSLAQDHDDTALLILGSIGSPHKVSAPSPLRMRSHLETSALYYHPDLNMSESPQHIDRAHISALSDTISQILIAPDLLEQEERGYGTLAPFILSKTPLPPRVDVAQRGTYRLTRIQDYYLFERPHSAARLWRASLDESSSLHNHLDNLAESSPILLRTLRDRLMISSLFQGLEDAR